MYCKFFTTCVKKVKNRDVVLLYFIVIFHAKKMHKPSGYMLFQATVTLQAFS